jgi:multicomponent Na+:H+ antiporter subunit D
MVMPALIFILGAALVPLARGKARSIFLLTLPVLSFINLLAIPHGVHLSFEFLGMNLVPLRVDKLSLVWGYIFHIITFLGMLYALKENNNLEYMAALLYAGSSLGVVFAGDLFTLFCFWELMALGSVLLVWARRTERSRKAGFRYLLVHLGGGLLLLFGIILYYFEHGTIDAGYIGLDGGIASLLIFLGVGVNCAWPVLHNWLVDAYPEATVAGSVFLSAYTTKTAVYVLARMFPGAEPLIWIGALMTAFPIFYAVIENDLRRVLSYSLINQVGFMVVGIGIGTELSLNGTAAHAFAHILYKALLFMSMGAVLRQTGKINATDLGGLYKSMPWTAMFCVVGAASISAFPLFSGFVSKSLIMSASAHEGYIVVWFTLLFASAGVFHHSGIKIPFFAFFSHDSGLRPKEAPLNMLIAMGITAFLCIGIGVYPEPLYRILPYEVDYVPYTVSHVLAQLELLIFSALAFTLLMLSGTYPAEMRAVNLDTDWFYRRGSRAFLRFIDGPLSAMRDAYGKFVFDKLPRSLKWFSRNPVAAMLMGVDHIRATMSGPASRVEIKERIRKEREVYPGDIIKHWPVGTTVLWVTLALLVFLLIYYL